MIQDKIFFHYFLISHCKNMFQINVKELQQKIYIYNDFFK